MSERKDDRSDKAMAQCMLGVNQIILQYLISRCNLETQMAMQQNNEQVSSKSFETLINMNQN